MSNQVQVALRSISHKVELQDFAGSEQKLVVLIDGEGGVTLIYCRDKRGIYAFLESHFRQHGSLLENNKADTVDGTEHLHVSQVLDADSLRMLLVGWEVSMDDV